MSHYFVCIRCSCLFLWKYLIRHALMSELLLEWQKEEERAKKLRSTVRDRKWKSHQLLCKLYYCHHCGGFGACDRLETERTEAHWEGRGEGQCVPVGLQCQGAPSTELCWQTFSCWSCQRRQREATRGMQRELMLLLCNAAAAAAEPLLKSRPHTSLWKHSITF